MRCVFTVPIPRACRACHLMPVVGASGQTHFQDKGTKYGRWQLTSDICIGIQRGAQQASTLTRSGRLYSTSPDLPKKPTLGLSRPRKADVSTKQPQPISSFSLSFRMLPYVLVKSCSVMLEENKALHLSPGSSPSCRNPILGSCTMHSDSDGCR
jgi:hypothetical protein